MRVQYLLLAAMVLSVLTAGSLLLARAGLAREDRTNPEETAEYCTRTYDKCLLDCDKDPLNKSQYDLEACYSSCWSAYSGCGK